MAFDVAENLMAWFELDRRGLGLVLARSASLQSLTAAYSGKLGAVPAERWPSGGLRRQWAWLCKA